MLTTKRYARKYKPRRKISRLRAWLETSSQTMIVAMIALFLGFLAIVSLIFGWYGAAMFASASVIILLLSNALWVTLQQNQISDSEEL